MMIGLCFQLGDFSGPLVSTLQKMNAIFGTCLIDTGELRQRESPPVSLEVPYTDTEEAWLQYQFKQVQVQVTILFVLSVVRTLRRVRGIVPGDCSATGCGATRTMNLCHRLSTLAPEHQGDQIMQIFANWSIVYFGQLKKNRISPNFLDFFFPWYRLCMY
jgi:hypothetical protein